jgi:hypothetical protein
MMVVVLQSVPVQLVMQPLQHQELHGLLVLVYALWGHRWARSARHALVAELRPLLACHHLLLLS